MNRTQREQELKDAMRGARGQLKEFKRLAKESPYHKEQADKVRKRLSIYAQELHNIQGGQGQ